MDVNNKLPYKKTGIVIAALNILAIISAVRYFLFVAEFPVITWLLFNICTPSVVLYLTGFFSKRREIMAAAIPFLAFFGGGGLFTFGWTGFAIISQLGHVFMTLAVIYTVIVLIRERKWKLPAIGFIIGLVVFCIFLPVQWNYIKSHPDYLKKLGDPKFEEMMQNK